MPYIIQIHPAGPVPEDCAKDRPTYFCALLHPPSREDLSPARVWHKLATHHARHATQFTIFEQQHANSLAQQLCNAGVKASVHYRLPWQLD